MVKSEFVIPEGIQVRHSRMSAKLVPSAQDKIHLAAMKYLQQGVMVNSKASPFDLSSGLAKGAFPGVLGSASSSDIEAIAFLVMMEAAKSSQDDLSDVMASVKAINNQKQALRKILDTVNKLEGSAKATDASDPRLQHLNVTPKKPKLKTTATKVLKLPISVLGPDPKLPSNAKTMTKAQLTNLSESTKSDLDTLTEMGEAESLRLQEAQARLTKMMQTLSNLLKKMGDTDSTIIKNLK